MSSGNQFEDKATRLLNRLSSVSNPIVSKTKLQSPKMSLSELTRLREELEASDQETQNKCRGLKDTLRKLECSLNEEGQVRTQKDETFVQTISKLQKNMKSALNNVQRGFTEREKKLQDKIESLIRNEKKELDNLIAGNEELINQMDGLETKIAAIVDEVVALRRARGELEERINRQFTEQLKELKKIFEADIRGREEREGKVVQGLKMVYKNGMEKVYGEEREREESQKMLMGVIEQLVNHIIEV